MLKIKKITTLDGSSIINEQVVMTMYASVSEEDSQTISQTILNKELYLSNKEECDNDYMTFKKEADKLLQNL